MQQPSKKYKRIAEAYRFYASNIDADFSEKALIEFFNYETFGKPVIKYNQTYDGMYNGYAIGKHWLDVNLAMYREDILIGNLTKYELLQDNDIPELVKDIVVNKMSR